MSDSRIKAVEDMLNAMYPKTRRNGSASGWIPMNFFRKHEKAFHAYARAKGFRVIYRGPRDMRADGLPKSMTLKADATHAVFYWK